MLLTGKSFFIINFPFGTSNANTTYRIEALATTSTIHHIAWDIMDEATFYDTYGYNLTAVSNTRIPKTTLFNVAAFNRWRCAQSDDGGRYPEIEAHIFYYQNGRAGFFISKLPLEEEESPTFICTLPDRMVALMDPFPAPIHPLEMSLESATSSGTFPDSTDELRWLFEDLDRCMRGRLPGSKQQRLWRERPLRLTWALLREPTTTKKQIRLWTFRFTWYTDFRSFFAASGAAPPSAAARDTLDKLFEKYRGMLLFINSLSVANSDLNPDAKNDEEDTIGVDGTMNYLEALGVNLENASMLVPMEIVQAPTVGELSKEGFVDGWKAVRYVSSNLFTSF
jgi:hypothetical protein